MWRLQLTPPLAKHVLVVVGGSLLLLVITASFAACQNIDTDQPVLREVSGLENNALFGYSLLLHQAADNPTTMAEALSGARIIVSAPNGTAAGASVPNTGLVYSCPVNPGQCSPLPGKLFDTTSNNHNEDKSNQFLGASMASNGGRFVVCAHKYARKYGLRFEVPFFVGKCFITEGRALEVFQEFTPCANMPDMCQAGTSSVITLNRTSYVLGLGAPSTSRGRGSVIRKSGSSVVINSALDTSDNAPNSLYQGYAIVGGRFLTQSRLDYAVSLPRNDQYFGSVRVRRNDNDLHVVSQPLRGKQMGEYYGFSLLAVDLNGDGYDELLVGAPLYRANSTQPETGRVFLYRNTRGNLEFVRTIEGRTQYSRFGYAMANLGDVNGDGFDDVAISAPFSETGSSDPGTVYIYHSTPSLLLTNEPQQIIQGTDLNLSLQNLKGFGTSLASGVDVDLNSYNDLLIGSFLSQKVFLLRTRPLARVTATLTATPQIVDVMKTECTFNDVQYACFNLSACAMYTGREVSSTLSLIFTVSGDTESNNKRVFFENGDNQVTRNVGADIGIETCSEFTAYIRNDTGDTYNPFVIELSIANQKQALNFIDGSGNETLYSLDGEPSIQLAQTPKVQVETLKPCGNTECIPDLRVSIAEISTRTITVGRTSAVDIILDIRNAGEEAFQASMLIDIPTYLLEVENVFNQTKNGEVTLRCVQMGMSQNCSIGNPFSGQGSIHLRVRLKPSSEIIGSEMDTAVTFVVSSLNSESRSTIDDGSNVDQVVISFEARANISIENGVVTPEQISYSEDISALPNAGIVTAISDLGPVVDVSFLIRNSGPSRIPEVQLDISWPLNGTMTGNTFYLYITSIQSSGSATVMCNTTYVNPLMLNDESSEMPNSRNATIDVDIRNRKKRSVSVKRTLRNRRQIETDNSLDKGLSENRTLDCNGMDESLNCVTIQCYVAGLPGSSSVQVDITSRLDERFFSTNNDRYVLIPTASVSIKDAEYIKSNRGSSDRSANAHIRIIPAARVFTAGGAIPIPWWAIFVPILIAVILIVLIAILLWFCGFFRRKKHEEIKQKREELENLTAHGVSGHADDSNIDILLDDQLVAYTDLVNEPSSIHSKDIEQTVPEENETFCAVTLPMTVGSPPAEARYIEQELMLVQPEGVQPIEIRDTNLGQDPMITGSAEYEEGANESTQDDTHLNQDATMEAQSDQLLSSNDPMTVQPEVAGDIAEI